MVPVLDGHQYSLGSVLLQKCVHLFAGVLASDETGPQRGGEAALAVGLHIPTQLLPQEAASVQRGPRCIPTETKLSELLVNEIKLAL
jgi:hypothetical protein